jgi:protein-S-isoprenylcysteine O-methyltransferase Ste14
MTETKKDKNLFRKIYDLLIVMISIAGYVPRNATLPRTIAIVASLAAAIYIGNYQAYNSDLAISYFIVTEALYIGFITAVLSENGLRNWFISKWGENEGYLAFEAILGLLFFHNGFSIGYIAAANPGRIFSIIDRGSLLIIVAILSALGFAVKLFAAKAVSVEIYYWKDMFLGKKISDFVITGPYKFLKNPMYGVGQIQAYAFAAWYGSAYGLMAALINQLLIFSFYYLAEKKFIKRVYQKIPEVHISKAMAEQTVETY